MAKSSFLLQIILFYQPFEPFELNITKINLRLKFLNLFLLNSSMTLCLVFILIFIIFIGSVYSSNFIPNILRYHSNALLLFAVSQVKNQLGQRVTPWLSLFIFFFVFILFSNYFGLIPSSFTLTSHFNYVLIPTSSIFLGITIRVFTDNFYSFIHHFVPSGIPKVIGVFLFGIEIISYLFRAISLPVRVFANMVSGHVLLFLMATALYMNFEVFTGFSLKIALIILLFIWFAVYHLELLVAYLQAYVFLTMISIYAKDMGHRPKSRFNFRIHVFKERFFSFIIYLLKIPYKLVRKYIEFVDPDRFIKPIIRKDKYKTAMLPKHQTAYIEFIDNPRYIKEVIISHETSILDYLVILFYSVLFGYFLGMFYFILF